MWRLDCLLSWVICFPFLWWWSALCLPVCVVGHWFLFLLINYLFDLGIVQCWVSFHSLLRQESIGSCLLYPERFAGKKSAAIPGRNHPKQLGLFDNLYYSRFDLLVYHLTPSQAVERTYKNLWVANHMRGLLLFHCPKYCCVECLGQTLSLIHISEPTRPY